MARVYAGILGPLAFLTSLARGALNGGSAESVLFCAWCCLLAFAAAGYVIGWVAERTIAESVRGRILAELDAESAEETSGPSVSESPVT